MDKYLTRSSSTSSINTKRAADDEAVDCRTPNRYASINNQEKIDKFHDQQHQFHNLPVDNDVNTGSEFFKEATTTAKKSGSIPPIILEVNTKNKNDSRKIKFIVCGYSNHFHLQYRNNNKVSVICYLLLLTLTEPSSKYYKTKMYLSSRTHAGTKILLKLLSKAFLKKTYPLN